MVTEALFVESFFPHFFKSGSFLGRHIFHFIEKFLAVPVVVASVGPGRGQDIFRKNVWG